MADQVYTAALDYNAFATGIGVMEEQTHRFAGAFDRGMAEVDRRAREGGGALRRYHAEQKSGSEMSLSSILSMGGAYALLQRTARFAYSQVNESLQAYAGTSDFAKTRVEGLTAAYRGFREESGRLIAQVGASGSVFFGGATGLKAIGEELGKLAVAGVLGGGQPGAAYAVMSGLDAQARAGEAKEEARVAGLAAVALQDEIGRALEKAAAARREDASLALAELAAADRLRERYDQINRIKGLSVEAADRLAKAARDEAAATVEAARAAKRAADEKLAAERAAANEQLARMAQRAALEGFGPGGSTGDSFVLDQLRRRLELEERIAEVRRGGGDEAAKAAAIAALEAKGRREDEEASRAIAREAADLAVQNRLDALSATAATKDAAELVKRMLDDQKRLDDLKRAGAFEEELAAVRAAQEEALAASAMGLAAAGGAGGGRQQRGGRLEAGFVQFASQVMNGAGAVGSGKRQEERAQQLVDQAKRIYDRMGELQRSLSDVGGLAP